MALSVALEGISTTLSVTQRPFTSQAPPNYNAFCHWFTRRFMPVRQIRANHRSLTGHIVSIKDRRPHAFESSLERDLLLRLDFDPGVRSFETQPVQIEYEGERGKTRHYTPDALAHFYSSEKLTGRAHFRAESPSEPGKSPKPRLYEVKYADELRKRADELEPKLEAARAFAQRQGWDFAVVTEENLRTPYLENVKLLRKLKDTPIENPRMRQAMDLMRERGRSQPEELSRAMCKDPWDRAVAIRLIWHLIARDWLEADLNQTLTMSSLIWMPGSFEEGRS